MQYLVGERLFIVPSHRLNASISEALAYKVSPKDRDGYPSTKDKGKNDWDFLIKERVFSFSGAPVYL